MKDNDVLHFGDSGDVLVKLAQRNNLVWNFRFMRAYKNSWPKAVYKAIRLCFGRAILNPKYWNIQKQGE